MARVTIYLPDELHRRWRNASWVNLSKLTARALAEILDRDEDAGETVWLCEMCERRVARALHPMIRGAAPDVHTGYVPPVVATSNGKAAVGG